MLPIICVRYCAVHINTNKIRPLYAFLRTNLRRYLCEQKGYFENKMMTIDLSEFNYGIWELEACLTKFNEHVTCGFTYQNESVMFENQVIFDPVEYPCFSGCPLTKANTETNENNWKEWVVGQNNKCSFVQQDDLCSFPAICNRRDDGFFQKGGIFFYVDKQANASSLRKEKIIQKMNDMAQKIEQNKDEFMLVDVKKKHQRKSNSVHR